MRQNVVEVFILVVAAWEELKALKSWTSVVVVAVSKRRELQSERKKKVRLYKFIN